MQQRRRYLLCSLHCSLSLCCAVRGGAARPSRRHRRRQVPSCSGGPSLPLPLRLPVSLLGAVTDHELFSCCFGGRFNLLQVHAQESSFSIPGGVFHIHWQAPSSQGARSACPLHAAGQQRRLPNEPLTARPPSSAAKLSGSRCEVQRTVCTLLNSKIKYEEAQNKQTREPRGAPPPCCARFPAAAQVALRRQNCIQAAPPPPAALQSNCSSQQQRC